MLDSSSNISDEGKNLKVGECLLALIVIIRSNIIIAPHLLRFKRTGADHHALSFDDDLDNDFEVLIISTI